MFKRLLPPLLLITTAAFGQNSTTVSGTVQDLDGQLWFNGVTTATFVAAPGTVNGQYVWAGGPFNPNLPITANMNSSGVYTFSLPANNAMAPAGSKWQIQVISGTTSNVSQTFTVSVAGTTQTVNFNPPAIRISATPGAVAYADLEVAANTGGAYYRLNSNPVAAVLRVCQTGALGVCSLWSTITGGGGGTPPAGFLGDMQVNGGGGTLAAGHINDGSSIPNTLAITENTANFGPNGPDGIDVTAPPYYARVVNAAPTAVVTCSATSTSIPVISGGSGFLNNDGIVIPGCGATEAMTTPTAPTVTPSVPTAATGTGYTTAGAAGSTTIAYKIFGIDAGDGFTAPSSAGTTTTANNAMGTGTLTITAGTISGTTKTYTVSTNTNNLSANDWIQITSTGDDGEWGGWVQITAVLNSTQFSVDTGLDARAGITTSSISAGTVTYMTLNHVAFSAPSDGHTIRYGILRSVSGGAYCLVHITLPVNLSNSDPTYLVWDDLGTTQNPCLANPPWWLPTTDGFSAQNDMLVTQITSGAGTATLTVANAAGNNNPGSSVTGRFGNDYAIVQSYTRSVVPSAGSGGMIYFPPAPEDIFNDFCYFTSSFIDLASISAGQMNITGPLCLGDTIRFQGTIHGIHKDAFRESAPSFPITPEPVIYVQAARPGIWLIGAASGMDHLSISAQGNDYLGVFYSPTPSGGTTGPCFVNEVNFASDQSNLDYTGVLWETLGNTSSGFGCYFTNTSWNTGPSQAQSSFTPLWIDKNDSRDTFDGFLGSRRGFFLAGIGAAVFKGLSTYQGYVQPIVSVTHTSAGSVRFQEVVPDTSGSPLYASSVNGGYGGVSSVILENSTAPTGPSVSGHVIPHLELNGSFIQGYQNLGQNINVVNVSPVSSSFPLGVTASAFYLPPVITAPTAFTGATFFNLYSDAWPAFNINNSSNKYFLISLPSSVTWTTGQCAVTQATANLWTLGACGSGANTALSNLVSVAINTSLLTGTNAIDLGSSTKPFRSLYLYGSGTYGTNYFNIGGTPTSTRSWTIPDVSDTFVGLAATQTLTNKTLTSPVINTGVSGTAVQGTDSLIMSAGTVSGTGASLCTDANGGATTTGCTAGGNISNHGTLTAGYIPEMYDATHIENSPIDDSITTASTITSQEPIAIVPASGNAGVISWSGNTTIPTCPANKFCITGFNSASATVYGWQPSTTAPTANNIMFIGAPNGITNEAPITYGTAIPNGITGTTQSANDNSTKLATTAYVDAGLSTKGAGTVTHTVGALTANAVMLGNGSADSQVDTPNQASSNPGALLVGTTPKEIFDAPSNYTIALVDVDSNGNVISAERPISRTQCVNVTPVTLAGTSTTNDQNLMSCTLDANLLNQVGRTLKVTVKGVYTTPAANVSTLTLKVKLCTVSGCGSGTVIAPTSIVTGANAGGVTNNPFSLESEITTQTASTSSAYEASGRVTADLLAAATGAAGVYLDTNTATVGTIDSTGVIYLQVTIAFSSASASNVATERKLIVEVLN